MSSEEPDIFTIRRRDGRTVVMVNNEAKKIYHFFIAAFPEMFDEFGREIRTESTSTTPSPRRIEKEVYDRIESVKFTAKPGCNSDEHNTESKRNRRGVHVQLGDIRKVRQSNHYAERAWTRSSSSRYKGR